MNRAKGKSVKYKAVFDIAEFGGHQLVVPSVWSGPCCDRRDLDPLSQSVARLEGA